MKTRGAVGGLKLIIARPVRQVPFNTINPSSRPHGEFMEKYLVENGELINDFSLGLSV
jgi:hypothetical protein